MSSDLTAVDVEDLAGAERGSLRTMDIGRRRSGTRIQVLVDGSHCTRPLANRSRDSLHGSRPDVADSKDSMCRGFERQSFPIDIDGTSRWVSGRTAKAISTDSEIGCLGVGGVVGRLQGQGGETRRSNNCQAHQEHGIAGKLTQLGEDDRQRES